MITILKIVLNSEPSALLKMSDMVGIELSQKPRRLRRFKNESIAVLHGLMLTRDHASSN